MNTQKQHRYIEKSLVSVIVPVLNELENVKVFARFLEITFASKKIPYEVIYIDDFSTDGSFEYLSQIADGTRTLVFRKKGRKGKAFSLVEGFSYARGEYLAMIDADLQYPVSVLPDMLRQLTEADIVVANRKNIKTQFLRKIASLSFRKVFGELMFGMHTDIQSGLKVFKRQVYETVAFIPFSAWTFDLEFLHRSSEAGFKISNFDISFGRRMKGISKLLFFRQTLEIALNAFIVRFKRINPQIIPPVHPGLMLGAGVGHRRKLFVTHTTLPLIKSAYHTFSRMQASVILTILGTFLAGILFYPLFTVRAALAIISLVYFMDAVFNAYVLWRSLTENPQLHFSNKQLVMPFESNLPIYSILCPLYKEGAVLPQFIEAIAKLDWPAKKLDVLLLLEEDDTETLNVVKHLQLPSYFRKVIVPYSEPKTKPKACNYGLNLAKGELIVIYDAEDIPEPDQLKKAYLGFKKSSADTACLQAKLNYYNPKQNLLTRFFTAEYSLWFDLILPGLQALNTSLPLGGTSNHFKTHILRYLNGWDTFNVTEDADLGIRLFKEGFKTAMIDSTTYEEANSDLHNWLRQRSRWIKGYMQSYLVHTRDIFSFAQKNLGHALLMHLVIGSKLTFILLNPLLWAMTISYFAFYAYVGPAIEAAYLLPVFYVAVFSLVFGNFLFYYSYFIGNAKRNYWDLMWTSLLTPFYWVLISTGAWIAFYQLLVKPYYWEKTVHGLHLAKMVPTSDFAYAQVRPFKKRLFLPVPEFVPQLYTALLKHKIKLAAGSLLIIATLFAHLTNLSFNVLVFKDYRVTLETIKIVSLLSSLFYLISIPIKAIETTITHKTAVMEAKNGSGSAIPYLKDIRKKTLILSLLLSGFWLSLTPFMQSYFRLSDIYPLLLFTPIIIVSLLFAVDRGYISGRLLFGKMALLTIFEPMLKLLIALILVRAGYSYLSYIAIPYSFLITYLLGIILFIYSFPKLKASVKTEQLRFPYKFFFAALNLGLSSVAFFSLDILLANHFLSTEDAAKYALLSLVSKIVYFLGSLSAQFVLPLASKFKDKKLQSARLLRLSVASTSILSITAAAILSYWSTDILPFIVGQKAESIIRLVPILVLGTAAFAIARVYNTFYLARNVHSFQIAVTLLTVGQISLIYIRHDSLDQFIQVMALTGVMHLVLMVVLHLNLTAIITFEQSFKKFYGLVFAKKKAVDSASIARTPAVLIYNWRDVKHAWAGGAEVYIHELAKRWVRQGVQVTVFCGNDGKSAYDEVIDGVKIMRRGGTFSVYIWAILYYVFIFRQRTDLIIDSENGIPFFTPLYARKPVFLLIHHVHQDIFHQYLPLPLAIVAKMLESKLMPFVYRENQIITVSESSLREIQKLGFASDENIRIVYSGIDSALFQPSTKTVYPSFIYLGRLKPHKNIDIGIKAFSAVQKCHPDAILNIVGFGESEKVLRELVSAYSLTDCVRFYGKVTEQLKAQLLARSWVMIQPSQVEGWGITVIEANGCGTPVVASNVSGLKDSVVHGKTGILVEPRNIKQFAHAMDSLVTEQSKLKMYEQNSLAWSKNFTWEKSADDLLNLMFSALLKFNAKQRYSILAYPGTVSKI